MMLGVFSFKSIISNYMNYRIVIVDDAPFVREVIGHLLKNTEFDIVGEASDGEEALRVALDTKPDLIIMDIVMPIKSGIQAAREIIEQLPNTRIVACSTESSEAVVAMAIEAGCCDYVVKPFERESFLSILRSAMKKQKEESL